MRYRVELFATFDPLTRDTDPTLDAVALAEMALELEQSVNVAELHAKTEWDHRRFNPALSILLGHVDQGRIGGSGDGEYSARYFALIPTDRVELKRFISRYLSVR
jgi:hypothetical protein